MSYDDRQAASILKKAAELQANSTGGGTDPRLSIDDLKRIGAEVGIAPEMVEEATRRLGSGSRRGKLSVERVLTVDRELGEREYEEIVGILRSEYGFAGTPGTLGSAYEWTVSGTMVVHMSMVPRAGKTTITVSQRRDGIVLAWLLACVFGFIGTLLLLAILGKQGQILVGALVALIWTLLLLGGTSMYTRSLARSGDRQLDDVMNRIADVGSRASATSVGQTYASDERPELNQQA